MIKNFNKDNVRVNTGYDGHYPLSLDKSIVIVTVTIPDDEDPDVYQFQTLVSRYDNFFWKSDFVNGHGKITEYTKEIIHQMTDNRYIGDKLDDAEISFIHLEDIPSISYLK